MSPWGVEGTVGVCEGNDANVSVWCETQRLGCGKGNSANVSVGREGTAKV